MGGWYTYATYLPGLSEIVCKIKGGPGNWHHIAVTVDAANFRVMFYVDGRALRAFPIQLT
jgi:hypothetical protein